MNFAGSPYFIPYLLILLFWLASESKAILFWVYLWQLKEYHLGRFLAHFDTAQGKSLFFNPLFYAKIIIFILGGGVFFNLRTSSLFLAAVFLLFALEAADAFLKLARKTIIRPVITKKSLFLTAAGCILMFAWAIFLCDKPAINLHSFTLAALGLLGVDILTPLIISAIVLIFQPLTLYQRKKILKKAQTILKNFPQLTIIAITGSYGKSTAKELLAHILENNGAVLKTPANQNTEISIAQTIINNLQPEHKFFVAEIGAVHKGKIKEVCAMLNPRIGIITGINQQHLGVFGSQQNIIDGKFELAESLSQTGTLILNWDSQFIQQGFAQHQNKIKAQKIIFVSAREQKDIWASDIQASINHLSFILNYKNEKYAINVNARGEFMTESILLAAAGALAAGMNFAEIIKIINKLDFTPYSLKTSSQEIKMPLGKSENQILKINIIESTYSENPNGVLAHLDYLKLWRGKKIIIMPCIIELGGVAKVIHFEIGKKIATVCDLAIIADKDYFQEINNGAISEKMPSHNIIFSNNTDEILNKIQSLDADEITILLEGRLPQKIITAIKLFTKNTN